MRAAIFATTHIQSDPKRAENWAKYYTEFFKGDEVDLFIVNDGKAKFDFVEYYDFPDSLGRQSVWVFPGWKRSFATGLRIASKKSDYIGHVESDCWILPSGKQEFMDKLFTKGYFTAYTNYYNFPETSLQVLNNSAVVNYFLDKYSCEENFSEDIDFELHIKEGLDPKYFMFGERNEGFKERYDKNHNFISGASYDLMRELTGNA